MEIFGIPIIGIFSVIGTWIVTIGMVQQAIKNRKNPIGVNQIPKFLYFGVSMMHVSNLIYGISSTDYVLICGSIISSSPALYVLYQLVWYPKKYSKTWESFAFLLKT